MEDAGVVVDYVRWLDLRIPIIHLYTYKNKSTSCRSFIPLEDTQPPVDIDQSNRRRRLLCAAKVDNADHLELGGHALLDTRRSTVKRWLGHSEADITSVGAQMSTLVSAHVFRQLAGRSKEVAGGQPTGTQTSTLPTSSWSPQATSPARPYSLAWYVEWSFLVRVLKWRNDGAPQDVPPETWGVVGTNLRFFDGCVF